MNKKEQIQKLIREYPEHLHHLIEMRSAPYGDLDSMPESIERSYELIIDSNFMQGVLECAYIYDPAIQALRCHRDNHYGRVTKSEWEGYWRAYRKYYNQAEDYEAATPHVAHNQLGADGLAMTLNS